MDARLVAATLLLGLMTAGSVFAADCPAAGKQAGNPFFQEWKAPFGIPPFDRIEPRHFEPAFEEGIAQVKREIQAIAESDEPPTFKNCVEALDQVGEMLDKVRPVFFQLLSAHTNEELQGIAERVLPKLVALEDDTLLNARLFKRLEAVHGARAKLSLEPDQLRLLEETYKRFVRGGAKLDAEGQARLRELNKELSLLGLQFGNNLLKETTGFKLIVDKKEELAGLPQSMVDEAAQAATRAGHEGKWLFTLDAPVLWPFLQSAENRELRRKMLQAYEMRGNNGNEFDNNKNVARQVVLRTEKAKLLGYPTWAHLRLEERMAKSPEDVFGLLEKVWEPALEIARAEMAEMQAIIDREKKGFKLEAWDWRYYAEVVRKEKYSIEESELRPYFELNNVLAGSLELVKRLFGVTFVPIENVPLYHPEARAMEVRDSDGKHLGVFIYDYHPRPSKRGGAWCGSYRGAQVRNGVETRPIMVNVGNFTKPTQTEPALLSVDEAETLFHELGHGIHGLMNRVRYAGLGGVPRDFVELPSQIMENWVLKPEVLSFYAKHFSTGEAIPVELVEKIQKARQFNQGFATVEYVAASYLDMKWHLFTGGEQFEVEKFEKETLAELGLMKEILPRYRSTYFNHTFGPGGGYSAGYYSYMWSEVLDTDAFAAFEEKGLFDKETATKFRKEILERGGSEDAAVMYRNFRGRDPVVEPLLKKRGLLK